MKLLGESAAGAAYTAVTAGRPGLQDVRELLPLALACFLLGAVETAAIGRMFATKHGYRLDSQPGNPRARRGESRVRPLAMDSRSSGGMSQSLVNESGGARTPISGLIAAGIILLVALFFTDLLRNLPQPVLAAVVLVRE